MHIPSATQGKSQVRSPFRCRARRARRGVTVLIVMLLISMTLSMTYALMRSQTTSARVQLNSHRVDLARQVAFTGMAVGLRKMYESAWLGVGTTSVVNLSPSESVSISYSVGDATLTSGSADFAQYPYRVTINVVGYAQDLADTHSVSSHAMQSVVQLQPRALGAQPSQWAAMQNYVLYQTKDDAVEFNPPLQIKGPVRLQGEMSVGNSYLWGDSPRDRFFKDLNVMKGVGYADERIFTDTLHLPLVSNGGLLNLLNNLLGLVVSDEPISARPDMLLEAAPSTYKLYPGGQTYMVPQLPANLLNVSLKADVLTNPLGLYYASNNTILGNNVTLEGTLLAHGNVDVQGMNIRLGPVSLPSLVGSSTSVQLPALAVRQDISVKSAASAQINGAVLAGKKFNVVAGALSTALQLTGRVVAESFHVLGRTEWDRSALTWSTNWLNFTLQYLTKPVGVRVEYYPTYVANLLGLASTPNLVLQLPGAAVNGHWQDLTQPIYVPAAGDAGLRWELVRWTDNP